MSDKTARRIDQEEIAKALGAEFFCEAPTTDPMGLLAFYNQHRRRMIDENKKEGSGEGDVSPHNDRE